MKILQILLLSLLISASSNGRGRENLPAKSVEFSDEKSNRGNESILQNNISWQERFGLTHDPEIDSVWFKPVTYYLSDKNCSVLARNFYYGELRPWDNVTTEELLELATTDYEKLRPFYRWCLNMTIIIEDGALGEYTGVPARKYAEKFPLEFFEYIDEDSSNQRYYDWVSSIDYSGYYNIDDYEKSKEIVDRMIKTMKTNCKDCDDKTNRRIEIFANECFK